MLRVTFSVRGQNRELKCGRTANYRLQQMAQCAYVNAGELFCYCGTPLPADLRETDRCLIVAIDTI